MLIQNSRKKILYLYPLLLSIISFFHLLYLISDQITNNGITYEIAYRNEYWTRGKGIQILDEAISLPDFVTNPVILLFLKLNLITGSENMLKLQ